MPVEGFMPPLPKGRGTKLCLVEGYKNFEFKISNFEFSKPLAVEGYKPLPIRAHYCFAVTLETTEILKRYFFFRLTQCFSHCAVYITAYRFKIFINFVIRYSYYLNFSFFYFSCTDFIF